MSSPPEPSSPLDVLERRAFDLAVASPGDTAAWESLREDLQKESISGAPPPDPEAARRSGEELRLLTLALDPHRSPAPIASRAVPDFRAGYVIEGKRGSKDALVRPAFAEALAAPTSSRELPRDFSDLWAVDLGLWRQLGSGPVPSSRLALQWLSSPGRRLIQEVSVLGSLPETAPLGAADFSPKRLKEVAGALSCAGPRIPAEASWYELHAALPGWPLSNWKPANEDVSSVLRILEGRRGDPVFLRGAALAWLLDRAASNPHYDIMGIQRDLREDLLLAFLEGFPGPEDAPRHALLRTAARLEHACLLQAARLVPHGGAHSTEEAWSLARWLQSCTFRSPFFGGDEESLAARLRALLPAKAMDAMALRDVLHPGRFEEEEGLEVVDLALVAGAARHYWPDASHPQLLPTPLPLVHALRRIAHRPLNVGERWAEALLQRFQVSTAGGPPDEMTASTSGPAVENGLGWMAHHVAPPLVARWLMTHHRISWLEQAPAETQRECLQFFVEDPRRYEWVAFVLYAEGAKVDETVLAEAVDAWRRAVTATKGLLGSQGALALMGAGLLHGLTEMEATQVTTLARGAEPAWRHRAFEAIAEAAEKLGRAAPWRTAMDGLCEMCADGSLDEQERLKAALLALRRASSFAGAERSEYLQRLSVLAAQAPFNQNVALRRELRRLGFSPGSEHKGGR